MSQGGLDHRGHDAAMTSETMSGEAQHFRKDAEEEEGPVTQGKPRPLWPLTSPSSDERFVEALGEV